MHNYHASVVFEWSFQNHWLLLWRFKIQWARICRRKLENKHVFIIQIDFSNKVNFYLEYTVTDTSDKDLTFCSTFFKWNYFLFLMVKLFMLKRLWSDLMTESCLFSLIWGWIYVEITRRIFPFCSFLLHRSMAIEAWNF